MFWDLIKENKYVIYIGGDLYENRYFHGWEQKHASTNSSVEKTLFPSKSS